MITDLALILVVAAVVALVMKRLNQPLVLGYIVAGFVVSPHMPYVASVANVENVETWADIGVMFLMFTLGLDFSFKKLLKMGATPLIAALTIIFCMMMLGMGLGKCFGWSRMDCVFMGGMLCMSSTTIIYKAFNDQNMRPDIFRSWLGVGRRPEWQDTVLSVLIVEDVLAIVLMVMLSTMAIGGDGAGWGQVAWSIVKIVFFLVLWFVVGLFFIPRMLKRLRGLMNDEILLVLSLGLCCLMAVVSERAGFSTVFGAFVMGSILSETIESEKIIQLVGSVKDLFGAVFFVSVGMLVDPAILTQYWLPIVCTVLTIVVGQSLFGSLGFLLSGRQSLQNALRGGFSMGQIGEFSFIIASMGLALGVISDFLYPVVVAASVVTIFLTPYMMRVADPAYRALTRLLPATLIDKLNSLAEPQATSSDSPTANGENNLWAPFLRPVLITAMVMIILCIAIVVVMLRVVTPWLHQLLDELLTERWVNVSVCVATIFLLSPFLRSMIMKKTRSEEMRALWTASRLNRLPLIFTLVARMMLAVVMVFFVVQHFLRFSHAVLIILSLGLLAVMIFSTRLKRNALRLEQMFHENLKAKEQFKTYTPQHKHNQTNNESKQLNLWQQNEP